MSTTQDNTDAGTQTVQTTQGESHGDTPATTPAAPEPVESGAEAAYQRAAARQSGESADLATDGGEQAAGGDTPAGESTQSNTSPNASQETEAAAGAQTDEPGEGESDADSTVEIPEDFPAERKAVLEQLPPEAQKLVLDTYKDMQAGLTKATQSISEIRQMHGNIVEAMQETGFNGESVVDLINTAQAFESDPENVLRNLAEQKGLEVYFSAEEAAGEIPQEILDDPKKYAKYIQDQTAKAIRQEEQRKAQAEQAKAKQEAAAEKLRSEFTQAASEFEDFDDHRSAVIAKLQDVSNEGVTVQDAYKLATYDQLRDMASRTAKAESEVKRLTGELEALQKGSTVLPTGNNGQESHTDLDDLDPAERALVKAQRRLAASQQYAP